MLPALRMSLQQCLIPVAAVADHLRRAALQDREIGKLAPHAGAGTHDAAAAEPAACLDDAVRTDEAPGADVHRRGDPARALARSGPGAKSRPSRRRLRCELWVTMAQWLVICTPSPIVTPPLASIRLKWPM